MDWLSGPVIEAEEERGLGDGLGARNDFSYLTIAEGRELPRQMDILFKLRD